MDGWMDGWMDGLRLYVLFNIISVISGRSADDNERLCAMEPCLRLRRFRLGLSWDPGPLKKIVIVGIKITGKWCL